MYEHCDLFYVQFGIYFKTVRDWNNIVSTGCHNTPWNILHIKVAIEVAIQYTLSIKSNNLFLFY